MSKRSHNLHKSRRGLRSPLRNRYLHGGLAGLLFIALAAYWLVDRWLMPAYTRHEALIHMPDLRELPLDSALAQLGTFALELEDTLTRFDAHRPLGIVLDQNPRAGAPIKPGRRVYLTMNEGREPDVPVPNVEGQSLRNARARILGAGLNIRGEVPDTIPSPVAGPVTRVDPPPDTPLSLGDSVMIWYGTGPDPNALATVPDLVGLRMRQARILLRERRLWDVVLDREPDDDNPVIRRQFPEPGTSVLEGSQIRLYASEAQDS